MGLLDSLFGRRTSGGMFGGGGGGGVSKPLTLALLGYLLYRKFGKKGVDGQSGSLLEGLGLGTGGNAMLGGGLAGGLGALMEKFQNSGYGDIIKSWIGTGDNQPVTPDQLQRTLDNDTLQTLSQRSGLPRQTVLQQLSSILPGAVDKMTPDGRLPTNIEANQNQVVRERGAA